MTATEVRPASRPLTGAARVPPDKSISHRAAILGAVADGTTVIRGYSPAGDCASTLSALRALGVGIERRGDRVRVTGFGERGPATVPDALDCGRSGTTMRLMAGVLASMPARTVLTGDRQLLRRPMERLAEPLRLMGAAVETADGMPPITVDGGALVGIEYTLPVASAQVKSAVLLAGLRARGATTVIEPAPSRDHTERLLAAMGASIEQNGGRVTVQPGTLAPLELRVPGDPSSAAPLLAAAALVPGSDLLVTHVGVNPTRIGFLGVLHRMGAEVEIRSSEARGGGEPVADVHVRPSRLAATRVEAAEVPSMIDELPLIGLLATQADGVTEVRGASELRVKESDRIAALVSGLRALGADAEELPDGFAVRGPTTLEGGAVDSLDDHRLAMTFAVAGLVASGPVHVVGMEFVGDSFPGFLKTLESLR